MKEQPIHSMMAETLHDERARQGYVLSLKRYISGTVTPGNKIETERRTIPAFKRKHKREPNSLKEMRKAMNEGPYHQMWGSLMRTAQELMWDSVADTVDRQLDQLIDRAQEYKNPLGSLRLDPNLEIPAYLSDVDIHCLPGGYHTEVTDQGDVRAGAIYDRGAYLYHLGERVMDDNGRLLVGFVHGEHPGLEIKRILEMGCTVGISTTAFVDLFPEAEVHAIDIGAPVVRYAHARAEAMGRKIHFAQANAEKSDYPDEHFDLIVSSNMLHETSSRAVERIFAESRRLLRPGGVMAHMEVPVRYKDLQLYDQVMRGWQTLNNAEPFWDTVCSTDLVAIATEAGLREARDGYLERVADPVKNPRKLLDKGDQGNNFRYLVTAVK
jgi:ubiquinone/menaquinone biosynthesis C-methylase UbiE